MTVTAAGPDLNGLKVLVTRPADQQPHFLGLLREHGAAAISLPLLEIRPVPDADAVIQRFCNRAPYDFAVFVSPNAVNQVHTLRPMPWPSNWVEKLVAVGDATDRTLAAYGRAADIRPHDRFSSERLLAEPALQNVSGKRVALFCADQGRKTLRDTLRERGARVDEYIIYESAVPAYPAGHVCSLLQHNKPDVICLTSNQGVENLLKLTDNPCLESLLQTPLIVNSDRCSTLASQKGFRAAIVVAGTPGDQGQLEGLLQWYTNSHVNHSE